MPWKAQDNKGSPPSVEVDLREAKNHMFDQSRGQEAPQKFIQRRTSDGELYTHRRSASASNFSLNLERHGTVYEAVCHGATTTLSSKSGSYRRLTSNEKDDRPVISLEDLHMTRMEQNAEPLGYNDERSASLDRKKISIYVEGVLKQNSQELEDHNGKSRGDNSDEDVTPIYSSASDLTPTGSVEDIRLKKSIKKRFSKRWWHEKYRRPSIAEGELVL